MSAVFKRPRSCGFPNFSRVYLRINAALTNLRPSVYAPDSSLNRIGIFLPFCNPELELQMELNALNSNLSILGNVRVSQYRWVGNQPLYLPSSLPDARWCVEGALNAIVARL